MLPLHCAGIVGERNGAPRHRPDRTAFAPSFGFRQLAEFQLFGDNPVTRYAERPELPGEVRNEPELAAQHHRIAFQGRDLSCDLSGSNSPTVRRWPQRIVDIRLRLQITLADFRVVDRVLIVADDVVEPDSPEIVIAKFKSEHAEERRDANARADADDPAEMSEAMGSEPAEGAVDVQMRPGFERG